MCFPKYLFSPRSDFHNLKNPGMLPFDVAHGSQHSRVLFDLKIILLVRELHILENHTNCSTAVICRLCAISVHTKNPIYEKKSNETTTPFSILIPSPNPEPIILGNLLAKSSLDVLPAQ